MLKTNFMIIVLAVGFTGPGLQAHERPAGSQRFSIHDLNHDGLLDRYEYELLLEHRKQHRAGKPYHGRRAASDVKFEDIDGDADGYISEDELIKMLNQKLRSQRRFRAREGRWSE